MNIHFVTALFVTIQTPYSFIYSTQRTLNVGPDDAPGTRDCPSFAAVVADTPILLLPHDDSTQSFGKWTATRLS